ncbi:LysR family transcriptional regulator [Pseudonocardia ailaonensis]|uniref:LysR family transcriptional regulator n=1 Tax=Pseudonocardia ailaonensis TaxID=367279 RepID=A0ABN2N0N1_9PSEU
MTDLRHVRAFLAIAEAGTVTAAAARLRIGQPALSRTLRRLEEHLGVRLVDRSTHHLELTPAGRAYRERAVRVVAEVDGLLDPGALWTTAPLRLGHAWSALGTHTPELLRRWRAAHPDTPLELTQVDGPGAGLPAGVVDAAVIRGRVRVPGVTTVALAPEARLAAVPAGSALAARSSLTLADLVGETVAINAHTGTTTPDLWPAGGRPAMTWVGSTADWLVLIAAGGAVGVTASATASVHAFPGVAYVPLDGVAPLPVWLAFGEPPSHPAVPALVELVREIAGA